MSGEFFGELYLRSTLPFLSDEVTAREVDCLARVFSSIGAPGPILDLGCGHGRHSAPLARATGRKVIGVEKDALSLSQRKEPFPAIRGDLRALPLRSRSASGAFAWYSTLFVFGEHGIHQSLLREIARVLRPGATLLLQSVPLERLETNPTARFTSTLSDGSTLEEESHFDPQTGIDRGLRKLHLPDGRILSGGYSIQYYRLPELEKLLSAAGFRLLSTWGGLNGEPLLPGATDLIVGAIRRDA